MKTKTVPVCYGQTNSGTWCQEWYESSSRHARVRAAALRKAGYKVAVCPQGYQVTKAGTVKMTLVDIRPGTHEDTQYLPPVRLELA